MTQPPPLFPMEQEKKYRKGIEEHIRRLITPIIEGSLSETPKKDMMVGGVVENGILLNIHNSRLYIDYSKPSRFINFINFENSSYLRTLLNYMGPKSSYNVINRRELNFTGELFNVRVKRDCVEVISKKNNARWFRIKDPLNAPIEGVDIIAGIERDCLDFFKGFMRIVGGTSDFVVLNRSGEYKVRGEDFIGGLDLKARFYNEVGKKVYDAGLFEFKDMALASNYIRNQALKSVDFDRFITWDEVNDPLRSLKERVKTAQDVINNSYLVRLLSVGDKGRLEEWLFSL